MSKKPLVSIEIEDSVDKSNNEFIKTSIDTKSFTKEELNETILIQNNIKHEIEESKYEEESKHEIEESKQKIEESKQKIDQNRECETKQISLIKDFSKIDYETLFENKQRFNKYKIIFFIAVTVAILMFLASTIVKKSVHSPYERYDQFINLEERKK